MAALEQSKVFDMKSEKAVPVANDLKTKLRRAKSEVSSPGNESINSKYLKLIKPLYVKASKIRIFDQSTTTEVKTPSERGKRQGGGSAVIKEVCRSLMKSKSSVKPAPMPAKIRDDSALEQQDGIRSAILHCKRSYSSSSSSSSSSSTISQEFTMFSRSASESSNQRAASQIISSNCTKL